MKTKAAAAPRGLEGALRRQALAYPEVTEDFPWGHRTMKVRGKAFLYLVMEEDALVVTVKLPRTGFQALALPFVEPTGYGLGKSGWITARIPKRATVSGTYASQCREWIDESYRAIAPKRLTRDL